MAHWRTTTKIYARGGRFGDVPLLASRLFCVKLIRFQEGRSAQWCIRTNHTHGMLEFGDVLLLLVLRSLYVFGVCFVALSLAFAQTHGWYQHGFENNVRYSGV